MIIVVLLALLCAGTLGACVDAATHTLDIGGAFDGLFLGDGWEPPEGPYDQYGPIWQSRCRWARQGARVTIPVFAGVHNRLAIRAGIDGGPDQRLRLFLNGNKLAELEVSPDLHYEIGIEPKLLQDRDWAELTIETEKTSDRGPGDSRDLRAAVDWIEVSANAPARDFVREILDKKRVLSGVKPDAAPSSWRFRWDPNNVGNRFRPFAQNGLDHVAYDDSGLELVPTSHLPSMNRGDAAWYRAWLLIDKDPRDVGAELRLPGAGFEKHGIRQAWVNGVLLTGTDIERCVAEALIPGPNLIVVKLVQGPVAGVRGDELIEQPVFSGKWSSGKVSVSLEQLTARGDAGKIGAKLLAPSGKLVGPVEPGVELELTEYGEHSLVVEDDRGRRQVFPVYLLGVHFFHWGWYSAWSGTEWRGFTPQSNDFIDQLFSRLDDWGVPHHSISWGGGIFAPGTGFHATKGADYPALFRNAINSGKLDLVGMPFPPRNICTDFGETLIRSMRRSLDVYKSVLGYAPTCFASHDSTLTPMLPQIMRLCGYDSCCLVDNWWGQMSVPNSRDCLWSNPDGSTVRMMDSCYHGISVTDAVRRAIEQGKPAVLCAEEFACLDATAFLEQAEWNALARQGIFLKPVSLAQYRQITEDFAAALVHRGDDGLAFKGWTGGSEGEVELEKASRLLENNLVALENLAALARRLGIAVDRAPIDEKWDLCLRWQECHLRFSNGDPNMTRILREFTDWCRSEMQRLGALIAEKSTAVGGVTVFNQLGFVRNALVSLELAEGGCGLEPVSSTGSAYPLQPDPDNPGRYLASLADLPSIGCRGYRVTQAAVDSFAGADVRIDGDCAFLDNGLVRIRVGSNGEIVSFADSHTGRTLVEQANRLFFARRHDLAPEDLLSFVGNPLNIAHYVRPVGRMAVPRIICSGPVLAAVECDLQVPDYPGLQIALRIGLAAGERQARIRLSLSFDAPTAVCPRDATNQHEGVYLPGIFAAFPMNVASKPVADMAYCLTEDVLASTNKDTFLNIPFRNCIFNALSLAGPNTEDYAILTRGLTDFFCVREPEPFLAVSFGMGTPDFPYREGCTYSFEYAFLAPAPGPEAYKAAQGFLVDAVAVPGTVSRDRSLVASSSPETLVTGAEHRGEDVLVRVLNVSRQSVSTTLDGLLDLEGAEIRPDSTALAGRTLHLKPRSIREVRTRAADGAEPIPDKAD